MIFKILPVKEKQGITGGYQMHISIQREHAL